MITEIPGVPAFSPYPDRLGHQIPAWNEWFVFEYWISGFFQFPFEKSLNDRRLLLATKGKSDRKAWMMIFSKQYPLSIGSCFPLIASCCLLLIRTPFSFSLKSLLNWFFKEPFKLARVRISGLQAGWILPGLVGLFWVWESDEEIFQNNLRSTRLSSWNFWRLFGSITGLSGFDLWIIEKRCLAWIP